VRIEKGNTKPNPKRYRHTQKTQNGMLQQQRISVLP